MFQNYACCRWFFPRQSAQWQGLLVLGLTAATSATYVFWVFYYEWCHICAASLNLFVSLLIMSALFQRASQVDASVALKWQAKQQQQQAKKNTKNNNITHPQQSTATSEEARMMSYSQIQANKWSHFVALEDHDAHAKNSSSKPALPGMLYLGPLPIPLEFVALGTAILSSLVFVASYVHDHVYLSMTKLTSIEDWFRTFFLLSYGVLGTFVILYWLPTIVYMGKVLYKCCCCCGGGGKKNSHANNNNLAEEDHTEGPSSPNNDTESPTQQVGDTNSTTTLTSKNNQSTAADTSTSSTNHHIFRTAADVQHSTRFAVRVLGVVSLATTIWCFVLRWNETQTISPVLRWTKATGALSSYQGDAWVTAMPEIVNENTNTNNVNNNDLFCNSPNDYIPVMVNVAWGGQWACPSQPETLCQSTVQAHVSCQYSKYPLPWQANVQNNYDNNNNDYQAAQEEQQQNNDQADDEQDDDSEAMEFASVEDYITFRFQNPIEEDDEYNQQQQQEQEQQEPTFDYDVSVAPSTNTEFLTWNRQAENILGNCETCDAQTVDMVQEQFPSIIRALHGLFFSMGVLCASVFWGILLRIAQQRQSQRQATDGMFDM